MQIRSLRIRPRAGWLSTLAFAGFGVVSACSSGGGDNPTPSPTPNPAAVGEAEVTGLRALAAGQVATFDSTPDPDGEKVYFISLGGNAKANEFEGQAQGVLMATNKGGTAPTMLASGFVAPVQVVTSVDGATVFVADPAVELRAAGTIDEAAIGVVYGVPASGGDKAEIMSTRGYRPRGLDVVKLDGNEWLYFVGVDPADGVAGVFRTLTSGGPIETIKKGDPLGQPQCVAVNKSGEVFVTDSGSNMREGAVLKIAGGNVSVLVENVTMATPAGLALSESEKFLLVSALRPGAEGSSAVVLRVEVSNGQFVQFDDGIKNNHGSAGIHRAHNADSFTWADSAGTIYLVGTKKNPLP